MATITLNRSRDFTTAIFLRIDLGQALSDGRVFDQNVHVKRLNGDSENVHSIVRIKEDQANIEVFRKKTSQRAEVRVPITALPSDAEDHILALTLEMLLS